MNELEARLRRLTSGQRSRVRAAYDAELSQDEFIDLVATVVLVGNARAHALGAATTRAQIERAVGAVELTPAVAPGRHLDEDRVRTALGTILDSDLDTTMQLDRLADNEPKQAATDGSHDVISRSRRTRGWTRSLNAGACELCGWLRKDGYVYPADKPMHKHTGCNCEQTPVVNNPKETA